MYRRYKRLSAGIFKPVEKPPNPAEVDVMGHLRLYGKYMECARLREIFRDRKIMPARWDTGHEKAIGASRERAAECEQILREAFDWWGREAVKKRDDGSAGDNSEGDPGNGGQKEESKKPKRQKRKRSGPKKDRTPKQKPEEHGDAFERSDVFMFAEKIRSIDLLLREFCPLVKDMCGANKFSFNDVILFEMTLELISLLGRFRGSGCTGRVIKHIRNKTLDPRVLLNVGCYILNKHRETGLTGIDAAERELRTNFPVAATAPPRLWRQFVIYHMYMTSSFEPEFTCSPCCRGRG
jgi:hypothetical protein